ncbi:uncharacterized protein [Ptychodera flava]|uniref:uncharacterized protein n=1 Tax=Ptychodera flava TaxID=63121 RepID=UPI00396A86E5
MYDKLASTTADKADKYTNDLLREQRKLREEIRRLEAEKKTRREQLMAEERLLKRKTTELLRLPTPVFGPRRRVNLDPDLGIYGKSLTKEGLPNVERFTGKAPMLPGPSKEYAENDVASSGAFGTRPLSKSGGSSQARSIATSKLRQGSAKLGRAPALPRIQPNREKRAENATGGTDTEKKVPPPQGLLSVFQKPLNRRRRRALTNMVGTPPLHVLHRMLKRSSRGTENAHLDTVRRQRAPTVHARITENRVPIATEARTQRVSMATRGRKWRGASAASRVSSPCPTTGREARDTLSRADDQGKVERQIVTLETGHSAGKGDLAGELPSTDSRDELMPSDHQLRKSSRRHSVGTPPLHVVLHDVFEKQLRLSTSRPSPQI